MSWNPWPSFFSIKILIQFQLKRSKLIFSRDSSKPVENLQCGDLSATFGELILCEPLFKAFFASNLLGQSYFVYFVYVYMYTCIHNGKFHIANKILEPLLERLPAILQYAQNSRFRVEDSEWPIWNSPFVTHTGLCWPNSGAYDLTYPNLPFLCDCGTRQWIPILVFFVTKLSSGRLLSSSREPVRSKAIGSSSF